MEVKVNEIKETVCYLYDPKDNYVDVVTSEVQLNDVRLQIARKQIHGYYIKWADHKIPIDCNGHLTNWPHGFYDLVSNQLMELISYDASK